MPPTDIRRTVNAPGVKNCQPCQSAPLLIEYMITDDDALGPTPPHEGNWCAVRSRNGRTSWRRISLGNS